ncbi:MAG: sigma 54-interacting transcriptional regulator [Myxococcales bacterium]|nr:sigma 54-interacting transcriptional regulator [Myxococcota bacterium]MDW8280501.1 sigma 54-interacting transcriptional regulator [Myxococcales bacterium]
MVDIRPYARLHSVAVVRDLIRKWWKLELFLVDGEGVPVAPPGSLAAGVEAPRPMARDNAFCRLVLHAPAGARRCAESLRVTLERVRAAGRAERWLVHECHLGFDVVACALWLSGQVEGLVAVSGLIHEPLSAFGEAQLLRKVREVAPAAGSGTDLERSLRRLPLLSLGEVEQLGDLLQLCAEEIQAHHEEQMRRAPVAGPLLGSSPAMQHLLRQIEQVARSDAAVLIQGEPGTGKERVARAIHAGSGRARGPLVVQPCAVFVGEHGEAMLRQELMGAGSRPGRLQAAAGGTLVLDEAEGLPPRLQQELAQRLADGTVQARLVCLCTVRPEAAERPLVPELLARLPLRLEVPPLRDRLEDIPLLCAQIAREHGAPMPSPAVLERLARHSWPGNVRELVAELLRLRDLGGGATVEGLSDRLRGVALV